MLFSPSWESVFDHPPLLFLNGTVGLTLVLGFQHGAQDKVVRGRSFSYFILPQILCKRKQVYRS